MSVQKKTKAASAQAPKAQAAAANISDDELDAIMNEIAELQNEMAEATQKPQKKAAAQGSNLKVLQGGAEGKAPPVTATAMDVAAQVEAEEEESILAEFHSGASAEHSLEGTLSDLGEEPSAGNSILDQVEAGDEPDMTSSGTAFEDDEPSMEVTGDGSEAEAEDRTHSQESPEETDETSVEEERVDDLVEEEIHAAAEETTETEDEAEQLSAEELENAILENTADPEEEKEERMAPTHKGGSGTNQEGTLSMTLTGNMTLNIRYELGGQEVTVGFSDNFLRIQLADGTEFKIPVSRAGQFRKAA